VLFPKGADPATIDPKVVTHLVLVYAPTLVVLYGVGMACLLGYRISRAQHAENIKTLAERDAPSPLHIQPSSAAVPKGGRSQPRRWARERRGGGGAAQVFVKIFVADLDRSAAFYAAGLGFVAGRPVSAPEFDELILRPGEGVRGGSLVLCRWKDGRALALGNAHGPVGLKVDDVDAAHARSWPPAVSAGSRRSTSKAAAWRSCRIPTATLWS
jgi:hypothetical protein